MRFATDTLKYVVCPQCSGTLKYTREEVLFCVRCRLGYPIHDGVPDISIDAALHLADDLKKAKKTVAVFFIQTGPQKGLSISLDLFTCMAVGRTFDYISGPTSAQSEFTFTFDDHTQKLIHNYLMRTEETHAKIISSFDASDEASFRRMSDLLLTDDEVSQPHAMLFFGNSGAGVLDLVSRNGTYLNGKEIESSLMVDGDVFRIGSTEIKLMIR